MSNHEQHSAQEPTITELEETGIGPDKLRTEDFARILGAQVVIPVKTPWDALGVYLQRQEAIRQRCSEADE